MDEVPVHVNPDHVHVHPRHTGTRWFDITMAVSAIFISTVSLYVAAEHGRTERELVEATSWPFPQSVEADDFGPRHALMFGVSNAGTGPAKVYSFEVNYKGQPVSSPRAFLHMCCGTPMDKTAYRRVFPDGTLAFSSIDYGVVRPGQTISVFEMPKSRTTQAYTDRVDTEIRNLTFRACYCSVLDECWNTDLRKFQTTRVAACQPPAHPYDYSDE